MIGKVSMLSSFVNSCSVLHFEQISLAFAPRCSNRVKRSKQLMRDFGWPFISNDKSNDKSLKGSNVGETCLQVVQTKSLRSSPVKISSTMQLHESWCWAFELSRKWMWSRFSDAMKNSWASCCLYPAKWLKRWISLSCSLVNQLMFHLPCILPDQKQEIVKWNRTCFAGVEFLKDSWYFADHAAVQLAAVPVG